MKRLLALAIGLILPLGADDETGFSTAPGASWERVDQLSRAVFDFSGGEFRLQCAAPTVGEASVYGLARGALLAPSVFGDCASSVDLTAWAPTTDRGVDGCFPAVLTRIQSPAGIGSVSGYGLSIIDLGNGTARAAFSGAGVFDFPGFR